MPSAHANNTSKTLAPTITLFPSLYLRSSGGTNHSKSKVGPLGFDFHFSKCDGSPFTS